MTSGPPFVPKTEPGRPSRPASPGSASHAPVAVPEDVCALGGPACGQRVCSADRGARARCPRSPQSLAPRCGRARAEPGSQPGDGCLWKNMCLLPRTAPTERALGGGGRWPGVPLRSSGGPPRPSRGALLASSSHGDSRAHLSPPTTVTKWQEAAPWWLLRRTSCFMQS